MDKGTRKRELDTGSNISRRAFLNGAAIAIGADQQSPSSPRAAKDGRG
jgi:hypothetical protein